MFSEGIALGFLGLGFRVWGSGFRLLGFRVKVRVGQLSIGAAGPA